MPEQTAHPSEEKLSAYNRGLLAPDEVVAIETHISDCEPCCETIVSLSSDDTFVDLLKESRQLPIDRVLQQGKPGARSTSLHADIPDELARHPRYEIVRLIGKGGMGDVYEAIHRRMERRVALKIINRDLFRKVEAVNRFHREVKTAAQLSHPNIVTAFDADQADDFHFMVMEFVDGVDLSQVVKDQGALPVADACDYIRQAAIGLQHAHECGMVHRDIKPHNLMVTANGTIKILDFGLASLAPEAGPASDSGALCSDLTAAGAIMGTPDFISPEQANDARQVDIRSDIYSLGATLYYLLSGRVPFDEGSVMHKLMSHAQVEPDSLVTLRDDLPESLVAIVSRMMAKDPGERYLTPKEVADALESFLRSWRPDAAESEHQKPSSGGGMRGLGGVQPVTGDMNPNWLSILAKWLFYISFIPIAVFTLDVFYLSDEASVAVADRALYYLLASVGLSTVAGVLTGVNQFKTSDRKDQRIYRLTAGQTWLIAAILVGAAGYLYISANNGMVRIEVVPSEDTTTLGTHLLTIVDTSGKKPLGGTSWTHQDDAAGITTHFFESANGRYKIELSNEVLTVNGDKYTLENPTDSIRIVDDRVEITRVAEIPQDGEQLRPNVNVASYSAENGHHWQLVTQRVEAVRVRLLHIASGNIEVASESVLEYSGNKASAIDLALSQTAVKGDSHSMTTTIEIAADNMQFSRGQNVPLTVTGNFQATPVVTSGNLAWNQPTVLYHLADWSGDLTYRPDTKSMIEASMGNARFVALEIEWVAKGETDPPEWFTQLDATAETERDGGSKVLEDNTDHRN